MFEQAAIESILKRIEIGRQRLLDNDDVFSHRYRENIKVVKRSFPDLYEVIKDYQPKNKNIFLESDGALNIYFPDQGKFLYSENVFESIESRFQEFTKKPNRTYVDVEGGSKDKKEHSKHEKYLHKVNYVRKEIKKNVSTHSCLPSAIGGIVFFGFEFGYQLVRFLDEYYAKHIYIYEKDIDLFYCSLYVLDWEWIEKTIIERNMTLHFFIGVDEREFVNSYVSFIRYNGIYMCAHTYIYNSYSYDYIKDVVEEFSNQFSRQIMGWGFFDDTVIGIGQYLSRRAPTYLAVDNEVKIFNHSKKDIPVLILANGPSLDENIDFVRDNKDNFLLFSCGTTLNTLYKYGIKPDFHVDLERLKHTSEKLDFISKDFLEGIIALTVNVMHPDFYDHFDRTVIGMRPGEPISSIMKYGGLFSKSVRDKLSFMNYSGPIVANLAMSYVEKIGFSSVYMIGVDCGFVDPDKHHSKKSGYYNDDGSNTGLASFNGQDLKIRKANFGGNAYTTTIMDTSRVYLELCIESMKKQNPLFHCYNLSNGVKIFGAEALKSDDVLVFDNFDRKDEIKEFIFEEFVVREYDDVTSRDIGSVFQEFSVFSKECIDILSNEFNSVIDLLDILSECNSHVMKQNYYFKRYNYEMFSGSFIYFSNEIVDLVLSTPDDVLYEAKKLIDIFILFIKEMPEVLENPIASVDPGRGLLDGKYNA